MTSLAGYLSRGVAGYLSGRGVSGGGGGSGIASLDDIYGSTLEYGAYYIAEAGNLTLDGTDVDIWNDSSGGGRHLLGISAPPTWVSGGGPEGTGCVQFNGTNDFLQGVFSLGVANGRGDVYAQCVARFRTSYTTPRVGVALYDPATTADFFQMTQFRGGDTTRVNGDPDGSSPDAITYSSGAHGTDWRFFEGGFFGDEDNFTAFTNGTEYGPVGGTGGWTGNLTRLDVGRGNIGGGFPGEYADVEIAELVIVVGATRAQREEAYDRVAALYPSLGLS